MTLIIMRRLFFRTNGGSMFKKILDYLKDRVTTLVPLALFIILILVTVMSAGDKPVETVENQPEIVITDGVIPKQGDEVKALHDELIKQIISDKTLIAIYEVNENLKMNSVVSGKILELLESGTCQKKEETIDQLLGGNE